MKARKHKKSLIGSIMLMSAVIVILTAIIVGGNSVSGWDWKDSIGPKEQRKAHLDLAWHQYIPNDVGTTSIFNGLKR